MSCFEVHWPLLFFIWHKQYCVVHKLPKNTGAQILGARSVAWSKFHTKGPTSIKSHHTKFSCLGFVHLWKVSVQWYISHWTWSSRSLCFTSSLNVLHELLKWILSIVHYRSECGERMEHLVCWPCVAQVWSATVDRVCWNCLHNKDPQCQWYSYFHIFSGSGQKKFGPLMVAFVGIPARGKTVMAHKLARYLNWTGEVAKGKLIIIYSWSVSYNSR